MKKILDACCGGRMLWFNKQNPLVTYMDNRQFEENLSNGQHFVVSPDVVGDFRDMPFPDKTFKLVIFDPPHLLRAGETSWLAKKYGRLNMDTWKDDLKRGFHECFRVLEDDGILVFKWSEIDIKISEVINLSPQNPLIGHRSGKHNKTHWILFMKAGEQE